MYGYKWCKVLGAIDAIIAVFNILNKNYEVAICFLLLALYFEVAAVNEKRK